MQAGSIEALAAVLHGRRIAVLTGAGCSTESGIPDYRGPGTRARARNPVQLAAFLGDPVARRRYWARSVVGWPRFAAARPNAAHFALADLERAGRAVGVITQNVDRLHHAAGSGRVVELHGALHEVRCLGCGAHEPRAVLQERLLAANPGFAEQAATLAPDGDADLDGPAVEAFTVLDCGRCGGVLKPAVVFFGDTVPRPVVDAARVVLGDADALLVVGSSLAVFSGHRFVRAAKERALPLAIVCLGPSRADPLADVRVEGRAGEVLPRLAARLGVVPAEASGGAERPRWAW